MNLSQNAIDRTTERRFELQTRPIPIFSGELSIQRERVDPLISARQHFRDELFAVRQIVVAHRQQMRQRMVERRVLATELPQRAPCRLGIHQIRTLYGT